jgi:hypothetical protein
MAEEKLTFKGRLMLILSKDFNMKICARMVPEVLSGEDMRRQKEKLSELLARLAMRT